MVIWHNSNDMEKASDSVREIMVVAKMRELCEADVHNINMVYQILQVVTYVAYRSMK